MKNLSRLRQASPNTRLYAASSGNRRTFPNRLSFFAEP
jgi:hypothetical protein